MKRGVTRRLILVAAVAAMVVPIAAFGGPFPSSLPTLSTDGLTGPGAVAYRFTVPEGGDFEVALDTEYDHATVTGEGFILSDGTGTFGFFGTRTESGKREIHVEGPNPLGVVLDMRPAPSNTFDGSSVLIASGMPAGTYVLVVGTVGDGVFRSATATLSASAGTVLEGKEITTGGFAYRERDFRGVNVVVGQDAVRPTVLAAASLTETTTHPLYGLFGAPFNTVADVTADGPGGSSSGPLVFFDGNPAGTYTLTVNLDVEPLYGELWAWGFQAETPVPAA